MRLQVTASSKGQGEGQGEGQGTGLELATEVRASEVGNDWRSTA